MHWNHLDPAKPQMAVHHLHADRCRQLRRADARRASRMGHVLTAAAAVLNAGQRVVHVCVALYRPPQRWGKAHAL